MALQEHGKPNWPPSLLFFGICVFVYYTLDNVDGKQARRTKTSSPLGMCMDHGCDVLGVSFIALGVARVILLDDHPVALLFTSQMAVLGSFWLSVWAQYHSQGILVLGNFVNNI
jgi:phosphatidylglycerophosphate synthase